MPKKKVEEKKKTTRKKKVVDTHVDYELVKNDLSAIDKYITEIQDRGDANDKIHKDFLFTNLRLVRILCDVLKEELDKK